MNELNVLICKYIGVLNKIMEVGKINLINDLFNNEKNRLIIPVYQRNYDWKEDNVRKLLDDLFFIIKNHNHHLGM